MMALTLFDDLIGMATGGDSGDSGDKPHGCVIRASQIGGDKVATESAARNLSPSCRQPLRHVEPAKTRVVAVSPLSPARGDTPGNRWLLIEGDKTREITVMPAETQGEVQARYPGSVVQIDDRVQQRPDHDAVRQARAWALLIGERDPEIIQLLATDEGIAWLRDTALARLRDEGDAVISGLTDAEAIAAADVAVDQHDLLDQQQRVLAAIVPAMRGRFAAEAQRAGHARAVLRLLDVERTSRELHR